MAFYNELSKYGDNVALIDGDTQMTYAELAAAADDIASGVPARSLVFCLCENGIASIAGYVGFLRRGAVPVLINPLIDPDLYAHLLEAYQPQYIWAETSAVQDAPLMTCLNYSLVRTKYRDAPSMEPHLAVLLTTSGSTGSPKLVRQTYANVDANTQSIAQYLGIVPTDRAITTLPMHYTYGLSIIQTHLNQGAALILTRAGLMDKDFWRTLREKRATTFGGVPYTYSMLKRLRFLQMDGLYLRYLTQAGGKLGTELHREFASGCRDKGIDFIVMYGATEATARMSYVPRDKAIEKAGSIGVAIPGGRFELVDANDHVISAPHETGELIYYGDNVTPGYAETREDLAKGDERNGRLSTGDMAQVDQDGYYYIVGRKKRFLKMFGNRTNLDEVEGILMQRGYESACVGEDDHMRIFTTAGDVEAVRSFISKKLNMNQSGFSVFHIDAIPRNEAGKVLYSELQ